MVPGCRRRAPAQQVVFDALEGGFPVREARIDVFGRKLVMPMAVADKRLTVFKFEELCNGPLEAADYIALYNTYHTICVANVPVIDVASDRNASRRFTKFIDEAYRVGAKVAVSAASPIEKLFAYDTKKYSTLFHTNRCKSNNKNTNMMSSCRCFTKYTLAINEKLQWHPF